MTMQRPSPQLADRLVDRFGPLFNKHVVSTEAARKQQHNQRRSSWRACYLTQLRAALLVSVHVRP